MSTNYYFEVKNSEEIIKQIKTISSLISEEILKMIQFELSRIHIGKRASGWKPLFKKTSYYSTLDELKKFYNDNKNNLIIKSEYECELTWEELEKELIMWDGKQSKVKYEIGWNNKDYYIDNKGFEWAINEFS